MSALMLAVFLLWHIEGRTPAGDTPQVVRSFETQSECEREAARRNVGQKELQKKGEWFHISYCRPVGVDPWTSEVKTERDLRKRYQCTRIEPVLGGTANWPYHYELKSWIPSPGERCRRGSMR